jgi:hypothetical protein
MWSGTGPTESFEEGGGQNCGERGQQMVIVLVHQNVYMWSGTEPTEAFGDGERQKRGGIWEAAGSRWFGRRYS